MSRRIFGAAAFAILLGVGCGSAKIGGFEPSGAGEGGATGTATATGPASGSATASASATASGSATASASASASASGSGGGGVCDPMAHVLPNEGLVEASFDPGCPDGMVLVTTFCVDKYEASLVYATTQSPQSWSPFFNPGSADVRAVSIAGAVPQAYIDQIQAKSACEASGKRLCEDDEWLRACQGPGDLTYPYGDTRMPGVCNDHRDEHPAIEYYGTDADWIWSMLGNACIDQLHDSLDTCGERTGCETAEGAFDMMGNVHEWTADPNGTFRGGFYVDTVANGNGCLYATTAHDTSYWDYSTGFRCCADAN